MIPQIRQICTIVQMGWYCQPRNGGQREIGPGRQRPKSIILKGQSCNLPPMPTRTRHIATIVALSLAGFALSGCGTINEKLAARTADVIPTWARGLPSDGRPRPGTPKYDEYMKERERKRLMPAAERGEEENKAV